VPSIVPAILVGFVGNFKLARLGAATGGCRLLSEDHFKRMIFQGREFRPDKKSRSNEIWLSLG
jgi:hypothetical protein